MSTSLAMLTEEVMSSSMPSWCPKVDTTMLGLEDNPFATEVMLELFPAQPQQQTTQTEIPDQYICFPPSVPELTPTPQDQSQLLQEQLDDSIDFIDALPLEQIVPCGEPTTTTTTTTTMTMTTMPMLPNQEFMSSTQSDMSGLGFEQLGMSNMELYNMLLSSPVANPIADFADFAAAAATTTTVADGVDAYAASSPSSSWSEGDQPSSEPEATETPRRAPCATPAKRGSPSTHNGAFQPDFLRPLRESDREHVEAEEKYATWIAMPGSEFRAAIRTSGLSDEARRTITATRRRVLNRTYARASKKRRAVKKVEQMLELQNLANDAEGEDDVDSDQ